VPNAVDNYAYGSFNQFKTIFFGDDFSFYHFVRILKNILCVKSPTHWQGFGYVVQQYVLFKELFSKESGEPDALEKNSSPLFINL
jgi:hypothetical protein